MTRQLLLDKGLELFEAQGYANTTVDEIAAGVGTTRTTFYLHFPSKGELVRSLVDDVDRVVRKEDKPPLSEVCESNDRALIREFINHKFDQWPSVMTHIIVANEAAAIEPEVRRTIDTWFDSAIEDMVDGLTKANKFSADERRVRAELAFGELEFLSRRWFYHGWIYDRETALDAMVKSWMQLLTV